MIRRIYLKTLTKMEPKTKSDTFNKMLDELEKQRKISRYIMDMGDAQCKQWKEDQLTEKNEINDAVMDLEFADYLDNHDWGK